MRFVPLRDGAFLFSAQHLQLIGGSVMYEKVSTNMNFVEREKKIEKFWKDENIFEKSIESLLPTESPTLAMY